MTDPLANVERLLGEVIWGSFNGGWLHPDVANEAREAVRLPLTVARGVADEEAAPPPLGASVSGFFAFARSLGGEPS